MLKRILVCAVLLIPAPVLADDVTPGEQPDSTEKNICTDIGNDRAKCEIANECFWDHGDRRCEWIHDRGRCARHLDPHSCNAHTRCFWDHGDRRCERVN